VDQQFAVSRERIRQIEVKALHTLRHRHQPTPSYVLRGERELLTECEILERDRPVSSAISSIERRSTTSAVSMCDPVAHSTTTSTGGTGD
jgi:Sigma-70, region 4